MSHQPNPEIVKLVKRAAKLEEVVPSAQEQLVQRCMQKTRDIRQQAMFIMNEGGNVYDPDALRKLVSRMFLDFFATLTKEEMIFMLSVMHTDITINQIT